MSDPVHSITVGVTWAGGTTQLTVDLDSEPDLPGLLALAQTCYTLASERQAWAEDEGDQ